MAEALRSLSFRSNAECNFPFVRVQAHRPPTRLILLLALLRIQIERVCESDATRYCARGFESSR